MGDLTNKTLGVIVILVLTLSLLQIVIISIYTGKHARILITPKASQNTGKAQFCIPSVHVPQGGQGPPQSIPSSPGSWIPLKHCA